MSEAVFLYSCENEEILNNDALKNEIANLEYKLSPELKIDLNQANGLLIFKNREQFEKITNLLTSETEKYVDAYFSKFDETMSVDEVNEIVDKDGFNPNVVYEQFEKFHSISSLRVKLLQMEDEWLDNEELKGENPSIYPISDRSLAIANAKGEYQIGRNIYRVEQSGIVYEIKNQDYQALKDIDTQPNSARILANPNVTIHNIDATSNARIMGACKAYVRRTKTKYSTDGKYALDMILDLGWNGLGSIARAKTKAYRKNWRNKWRREWTSMSAFVHINDYDINCTFQQELSKERSRNWAYYVSAHISQVGPGLRAKPNGTFYGWYSTSRISNTGLAFY